MFSCNLCKSNLSLFIFVWTYFIIQIILVSVQVVYYMKKNANICVLVARAAGILISFNMSFIILLILRRFLTWLASKKFMRTCLPFEHFQNLHKIIGIFILILSFIHTIAHCVNQCKDFIILNFHLLNFLSF